MVHVDVDSVNLDARQGKNAIRRGKSPVTPLAAATPPATYWASVEPARI
jgi:hypothetical protein